MNITLTWDLVIIVFIAIVTAYSYIVGKKECVKVIVGTYMAAVAVQGILTLVARGEPQVVNLLSTMGFGLNGEIFNMSKLILFMLMMIMIAVRGGFEVEYSKENWGMLNIAITGAFGLTTAFLILVTLATYIAGVPLMSPLLGESQAIAPILQQSVLLQVLVHYQDIWFALPALLLLIVGFYDNW